MANVQHASLTGADLHEPKGADSASVDTVYVSDGAGSGAWSKLDMDSLTSHREVLTITFNDIGTAGSVYIPFTHAGQLHRITTVLMDAMTTQTILTVYNAAGAVIGNITIATPGTAGDIDTLASGSMANNTVSADSYIRIASDGGATTVTRCQITIEYIRT